MNMEMQVRSNLQGSYIRRQDLAYFRNKTLGPLSSKVQSSAAGAKRTRIAEAETTGGVVFDSTLSRKQGRSLHSNSTHASTSAFLGPGKYFMGMTHSKFHDKYVPGPTYGPPNLGFPSILTSTADKRRDEPGPGHYNPQVQTLLRIAQMVERVHLYHICLCVWMV